VATCSLKNRYSFCALLGVGALAVGFMPMSLRAADPQTVLLVDKGVPTAQALVEGTWTQGDGEIAGQGLASVIVGKQGVGAGDFLITTRVTVSEHPAVRAGLVIDEVADFGLSTPQASSVYVRGFLLGDMTTPLKPLSQFGEPGAELTLICQRVGDKLSLSINGDTVWEMTYESERPLGKIAVRAAIAGTLSVREFRYEGTPVSLDGWDVPYKREFPMLPGSVDVFVSGEGGYHTYRIPAIVRTLSGTLLAFCEGRKNSGSDAGDIDILLRRSFDGGKTWTPTQLVYEEGGTETITIGNPQPVVDRTTGTVWLLFARDNEKVFVGKSLNEGTTWGTRTEITSSVKLPTWGNFIATGPGHGTQMPSGRLIFPSYHSGGSTGGSSAYVIFTDDGGTTWRIGQDMGLGSGEPMAAVLSDGRLMMNTRSPRRVWLRTVGVSDDWGFGWKDVARDEALIEPTCQGSLLEAKMGDGKHALLFSNPESHRRERLTVKASTDDGASWPHALRVYEGSSAYSDVVAVNDEGQYGVLFERDGYAFITFSPFHMTDVIRETTTSEGDLGRNQ
jgi:sialidase-1